MIKRIRLATGARFGRLVVCGEPALLGNRWLWPLACDCGAEVKTQAKNLVNGRVVSCGCGRVERIAALNRSHGATATRAYNTWAHMVQRCTNSSNASYPYYGARGIALCERWRAFENFFADMGEPPPSMSLDRIDNSGNYEPGNCRWATHSEQMRNTRRNVMLTFAGRAQPLASWASELAVDYRHFKYLVKSIGAQRAIAKCARAAPQHATSS